MTTQVEIDAAIEQMISETSQDVRFTLIHENETSVIFQRLPNGQYMKVERHDR